MNDLYVRVKNDVAAKARKLNKAQSPVMASSDRAAEIVLGAAPGSDIKSCATA